MANKAVFGLYSRRQQVENAVDELKAQGFRSTDVSVLFSENVGTKDFAHEKGTKAPEGLATGATSGAVVGGALGTAAGTLSGTAGMVTGGAPPPPAACPFGYQLYNGYCYASR